MDLYVLDSNFDTIGMVDATSSVIWSPKYTELGDFEICVNADAKTFELFKSGEYIQRWDDDMIGIIQSINLVTDIENGDNLIIKGVDLKEILKRRVVWEQTNLSGTLFECVTKLVNDAIISPSQLYRKIDNFAIKQVDLGIEDTINMQVTGNNLFDTICKLCDMFGCGFKVILENKIITLILYKGVDHSEAQSENQPVVFSPDFDNISNTNYLWDRSNFATIALVAGEGEGKNRKKESAAILGKYDGINRREIFVDARDLSTNDGEIVSWQYTNMLMQRGREKLTEYEIQESFDGEVIEDLTYQYKTHYNLGDIVSVKNEYGIVANARITAIVEYDDENGHKVIPSFSNWGVV